MSAQTKSARLMPLDLSKWRKVPLLLIVVGLVVGVIGAVVNIHQFAFSYLLAFMFCLSICVGSLFLVLAHHLFDAGWSVPIRRFCEHIASLLFPVMLVLWLPIGIFFRKTLYSWMSVTVPDEALKSKNPLFTQAGFWVVSLGIFAVWGILTRGLRSWSIKQDTMGGSLPTHKMRSYAYWGIFAFAATVTGGVFMWQKAMEYHWFSTMYGVYYFAGSVWMTLGLVYVITMVLNRQGVLTDVLHEHQFYFIGSLMFAFTVFYAYIHFAQYFIIWNGNIPEETFWYIEREKGTWFFIGMIIIFGHFFGPFLGLLRIDLKNVFPYMTAMACWMWLMHYFDIAFNIHPVDHHAGFPWLWMPVDLGCIAFMVGIMATVFLRKFASAAPYPLKDPRLVEAMGHYHPVPTQLSGGELDQADDMHGSPDRGKAH